jgi:D-sedoheptulose 7-phosphate isomerase
LERSSSEAERWRDYVASVYAGLEELVATTAAGATIAPADGFTQWVELTWNAFTRGQHLYFIGNGASAMMASHFAADACKNAGLSALAFNDASLLTATANDVSFEEIFALPLSRLARPGDLLIAISSSGNSPNIVRAIGTARAIPMHIVTLSGRCADNRIRSCGDLNFYVPLQRYGWVECAHQLMLHYWLDQYLNAHSAGAF